MQLKEKVAVVTGAASGIGLGMTEALAHRGMQVMMADIDEDALEREVGRLQNKNLAVTSCVTDVTQQASLERLLELTIDLYGKVHVLCNNAGVCGSLGSGRAIWEADQEDWDWIMSVNLQGTVNGIRVFLPHMLSHGEDGQVVNTSSILGLTSGVGTIYGVSKHAITGLTEGLYHHLKARNASIGATLLCPGLVATNFLLAERNRAVKQTQRTSPAGDKTNPDQLHAWVQSNGMSPRDVGEMVADAIITRQFYLLTHADKIPSIKQRFQDIVSRREPSLSVGKGF